MEDTLENKPIKYRKHISVGLLAHVDAGKTTLAEGMLYTCGRLKKLGRVDHGDAFLDNFSMERERGITIFSKQAEISWEGLDITLLDTPGHVDFSAEMERTLQVLDYCLLVIGGTDGVQGHVLTLWKLLARYGIPVFLFINKMDQPGADRQGILKELQEKLDTGCTEFGTLEKKERELFFETVSLCDEKLLEEYLERGELSDASIAEAVKGRQVFPCYFGSALRLDGVEELLSGIRRFALIPRYGSVFGARVYKISRDANGSRLTHLKVTGGILKVKMPVSNESSADSAEEIWEGKADQLRIYGGAGYEPADTVEAGGICAVTGLKSTFAGQGLGFEKKNITPVLVPVLTYRLILPQGADVVKTLGQLRQLEEEEPQLHIVWKEALQEIHVQVMGQVQIEILERMILERFGLQVSFGDGSIVYKETITGPVEGIGHFEPLRHYAEVHLLLEPGEPGSGISVGSRCSTDQLDLNWQRLVMTHLEERIHPGVLTGSPVTDMKITLLAGRAHQKHTEGGDFRQAVYRAVRQGLMQSHSILLEPVFSYQLEIPVENLGRAMSDIQRMHGSFDNPRTEGERSVLTGRVPVSSSAGYQREVSAYTRGHGRFVCTLEGYEPCHNQEEVVAQIGYDPESDLENPSSSVFCAHGAGFLVGWRQVREYAHVESGWKPEKEQEGEEQQVKEEGQAGAGQPGVPQRKSVGGSQTGSGRSDYITQEEIQEIFQRTYRKSVQDYEPYRYHKIGQGSGGEKNSVGAPAGGKQAEGGYSYHPAEKKDSYFLVDGYNIIFAWEDLRSLSEVNIDSARDRLMDICSNYQGYLGCTLILVFDAYKVKGNPGSVMKYHNIYVVYTKEAETADQYIEKAVHKIAGKAEVTVATSDRLEQMIIWGGGAMRLSARGFREAVEAAERELRERFEDSQRSKR